MSRTNNRTYPNILNVLTWGVGLFCGCLTGLAVGSPGYSYQLLQDAQSNTMRLCSSAVNNNGHVVYTRGIFNGFNPLTYEAILVKADGSRLTLISTTDLQNGFQIDCSSARGAVNISEQDVIALPGTIMVDGVFTDSAYRLYDLNGQVLNTITSPPNGLSGGVSEQGFIGGTTNTLQPMRTNGTQTQVFALPPNFRSVSPTSINKFGNLSGTYFQQPPPFTSGPNIGGVYLANPADGSVNIIPIGCVGNCGLPNGETPGATQLKATGFNDLNFSTYATWQSNCTSPDNFNPDIENELFLIDGANATKTVVAKASSKDSDYLDSLFFRTSLSAAPLNNHNRIAFMASSDVQTCGSAVVGGLYIADASAEPVRRVYDSSEVLDVDGRALQLNGINDFTGLNSGGINDLGQIVFRSLFFDTDTNLGGYGVFLATPDEGLEPGRPVLPRPEDVLPERGWRFPNNRCGAAVARAPIAGSGELAGELVVDRRFCFVDPEIAVGYSYAIEGEVDATFAQVLVPIGIGLDDQTFMVEFDGQQVPLTSGQPFDFTQVVAGGVQSFRITGIEVSEQLDPADSSAFVTGLLFTGADRDADFSFTMIPIVIDTDDDDGDEIINSSDNCPANANPDQLDFDNDGLGDVCDSDDDNDGLSDAEEVLLDTDPKNTDSDDDGTSDGDEADQGSDPANAGSNPGTLTPVMGSLELAPGQNLVGTIANRFRIFSVRQWLEALGGSAQIRGVETVLVASEEPATCRFDQGAFDGALCDQPLSVGQGWIVDVITRQTVEPNFGIDCPSTALKAGLNMVSLPCVPPNTTAFTLLELVSESNGITTIESLDGERVAWRTATLPQAIGQDFAISPLRGYVLHATAASVLVVQ